MLKFFLKLTLVFAILFSLVAAGIIFYYCHDLPDISNFEKDQSNYQNQTNIQINFSNGNLLANFGDLYHNKVQFYELPPHLVQAVIATEDRKFFSHMGIDLFAIIRASYVNHNAKKIVQGASTITQQLAKLLFLKPEKTFKRKIQEIILAFKLEKSLTKEQILTNYLNYAYFGSGNYGVLSAAKFYFGKNVSEINLKEAALLAGLLKAPSKLSPKNNKELSDDRTKEVLENMVDAGFLREDNILKSQEILYRNDKLQRMYFADFVNEQYEEFLDKKDLNNKNLIITSTLDEKIQNNLEKIVNNFIESNQTKLVASNKTEAEIAVVVMNKEGAILGLIGGRDYQKSPFNRALYAKRQMGSVFKTFIYLTAFENNFTPEDIFEDKKVNISGWLPDNYEGRYYGEVTLEKAFANSLNSVSVQLAYKLNRNQIINNAKKLGIISNINQNDLTIALGTSEVNLYELTSAFASIANDSRPVIPYAISKIKNESDSLIYERKTSGFDAVLSEKSIDYIKEILRSVIIDGTGKRANVADDIFGKTGTSQNYRDAWFIGFDSNYVIGVWIGNDDNSPTNKITGGTLPAELFGKIINEIQTDIF